MAFGEADGVAVEVQEWLLRADRDRVLALIEIAYREAKSGGHVAFGCADGRLRSVAMAEMLARMLPENGFSPVVQHAALERLFSPLTAASAQRHRLEVSRVAEAGEFCCENLLHGLA